MRFLLDAPKTLFEDERHRCVSYVPDPAVTWIVMDVSVLVGALAGRLGALRNDDAMIEEGGRLVRYVVSKQTDEGAWFYAEPPSASHITHDNYHTGFILDAIDVYARAAKTDEFTKAYDTGIDFYRRKLFEADGEARFMSDRHYPVDIHGCAQGVITFALQQQHQGVGADMSRRVLDWTLANMWDPKTGWFYYQQRPLPGRPDVPHEDPRAALVPGLDVVGARVSPRVLRPRRRPGRMSGFPGRELALDTSRSRFERTYARLLGAPANGSAHPAAARASRHRRHATRKILDAGCGNGVFSMELAKRHPEAEVTGVELEPELVARDNEVARRAGLTNLRFVQGDVTKLDFDGEFDLVVSVDNLEHVEDDVTAMKGLLRGTAPRRATREPRARLRPALVRLRAPGELRRPGPRPARLPLR